MPAKYQHLELDGLHKPGSCLALFYKSSTIPNIENVSATKKGNSEGAMGSKSKMKLMKSYKKHKKGSGTNKNKKGKRSRYNK